MLKNRNLLEHPAHLRPAPEGGQTIGNPFVELDSIDSTNNYAMAKVQAGLAFHGMACFAHEQYQGKGQRGKTWISARDANLILSVVLEPRFLQASQQFSLSMVMALGCLDFLRALAPEDWSIKWPNDLYWRDRKAGGILIENLWRDQGWQFAVAGIGINLNQTAFPEGLGRPISVKQITGKTTDPVAAARSLCGALEQSYGRLRAGRLDELRTAYNENLFKKNEEVRLKKGSQVFQTTIRGVDPDGRLICFDSLERRFAVGEIEWIF